MPANVNSALVFRLLLVVLVTAAVFSPVLEGSFTHIDDDAYVYRNDHVREGLSIANVAWALQSIEVSNWHPLTWMSYMLDVELFGVSAPHMHGVNLLLHILNCLLLFTLIARVLSLDAALIATLVFAIHPLHVETVAWISQRKELLSFLFMMLSAHAYLSYKLKQKLNAYYWSIAAFVCALMSKPMAVSFPLLLILLDYWPLQAWPDIRDRKAMTRYALEKLPFVVLAAVACVLALVAHSFAVDVAVEYSLSDRLILVSMAYVEYLRQFLMPVGLAFYYPVPDLSFSLYFLITAILCVALSGASIIFARRYPVVFVAWWWYVLALLPVIGIIKVGGQFVADRYTYLPLTGIIFAIAYLVHHVSKDERFTLLAGSVIVLFFCGLITYEYSGSWQHNVTVARRAIQQNPDNPIAYYVLVKGIEVELTQQVLDSLADDSACIDESLDVYAGVSDAEMACLQQDSDASSLLILAAQQFRDYELDASAQSLMRAEELAGEDRAALYYFNGIQSVLGEDQAAILAAAADLRTLPVSAQRSAALFLAYYQLGNLEAANILLNEVLTAFEETRA